MESIIRTVALCAFTDMEQRLFEGIFRVSSTRTQAYRRWQEGSIEPPDIYLVKQGKDLALDAWRELTDCYANPQAPTVEIGTLETRGWQALTEVAGRHCPELLKPISANRLLDLLDQLSQQLPLQADEPAPLEPAPIPEPPAEEPPVNTGPLIDDHASLEEIHAIERQSLGALPNSPVRGKTVLVVDDSASLRLQMDISLGKQHRMRTDFAADGATAKRKLALREYDIIFLDVMLPDMDGFEICRHIRRELHSRVPVVMLTSRDGRRDQLKGVLVQADDYLIKPVAAEQLDKALYRHLGTSAEVAPSD